MADTPKISVRGLKKSFGRKTVLDGIDLDIGHQESVVVIGGSGTGKSVTVKCILGLIDPDAGSIKIDGREVTTVSRGHREELMQKFGMLFQGAALFDSLSVWENVAFGLIQGRGMARAQAKDVALQKLGAVGLGPEVGELRPAELSGGMQKRVGLARAIAADEQGGARHHAAAADAIELGDSGDATRNLPRVALETGEFEPAPFAFRATAFSEAVRRAGGDSLFNQRVPAAARITAPGPFRMGGAALLADELGLALGHTLDYAIPRQSARISI